MKSFLLFSVLFSTMAFAENHIVTMKSMSFDPKEIEIKAGDTVEWQNKAYTNHAANFAATLKIDSGLVEPGKMSKKIPFAKPGVYPYTCLIHGTAMSGKVIVK